MKILDKHYIERIIDLRKVTKRKIEENIIGETEWGQTIAQIDGIEFYVDYRIVSRDNIYCPTTYRGNLKANRMDIEVLDNSPNIGNYIVIKTIRF